MRVRSEVRSRDLGLRATYFQWGGEGVSISVQARSLGRRVTKQIISNLAEHPYLRRESKASERNKEKS